MVSMTLAERVMASQQAGWCVSCSYGNHGYCRRTACVCDCLPSVLPGLPDPLDPALAADEPPTDTFGAAVRATVGGTLDVEQERAADYGDTWHLRQFEESAFLDHVLRWLGVEATPEAKRLLTAAAHADQKHRRLTCGGWKSDHVVDGNNYRAAFLTWWEERVS